MNGFKETLFPVKEVPAIGKELPINNSGYKFIVREDTGQVLSCMTDEYKLIKNEEIIDKAMPIIKDRGGVLVEENLFGDGARTSWKWKFPEIEVDVGDNDLMNPTISLNNSYDGSSEASALAGCFRIICSNGLVIGVTLGQGSTRHSIWSKKNNFEEIVGSVLNGVENVFKTDFKELINTEVNKNDVAKLIKLFPETKTEPLVNYILAHNPKSYWDLLNAATWVATHDMKRNVEATHKFESKIYSTIKGFAQKEIATA